MIAPLRHRSGQVWGALGLYRETGAPTFSTAERDVIAEMAPLLADGVRRGLLLGEAREPEFEMAPGLVILHAPTEIASMTEHARRWLDGFPDGDLDRGRLPSAVSAVAAAVLSSSPLGTAGGAESRLRTNSGAWVTLHGSLLDDGSDRQVAVIIEPAHAEHIAPPADGGVRADRAGTGRDPPGPRRLVHHCDRRTAVGRTRDHSAAPEEHL